VTHPGPRGERETRLPGRPAVPVAPRGARPRGPSRAPATRPHPPAGPLAARREPVVASRYPAPRGAGWVRRFVRRHGWRAYALPVLTVATLLTLVDMVTTAPDGRAGSPPASATEGSAVGASIAPAEGEGAPTQADAGTAAVTYIEQGAGTVSVVDGSSEVYGTGPLERFVVEVEDGIDVDGAGFAAAVEATLADPRSWGNGGRMSFQRVGAAETAAEQFDFRVSLVSPGSMETYCPGVGTGGYTSCRYGDRAVINLARWATAVPDYQGDIATYRLYVINHEVGHVFGNGHELCPGAGEIAPVMQQQTLGLEGCVKNAWPYP
jgi:Protein of unknown function (DUF3152)